MTYLLDELLKQSGGIQPLTDRELANIYWPDRQLAQLQQSMSEIEQAARQHAAALAAANIRPTRKCRLPECDERCTDIRREDFCEKHWANLEAWRASRTAA